MKFNVGDEVRIISANCDEDWEYRFLNKEGKIVAINESFIFGAKYIYEIDVPQEDGENTIWAEDELELI